MTWLSFNNLFDELHFQHKQIKVYKRQSYSCWEILWKYMWRFRCYREKVCQITWQRFVSFLSIHVMLLYQLYTNYHILYMVMYVVCIADQGCRGSVSILRVSVLRITWLLLTDDELCNALLSYAESSTYNSSSKASLAQVSKELACCNDYQDAMVWSSPEFPWQSFRLSIV